MGKQLLLTMAIAAMVAIPSTAQWRNDGPGYRGGGYGWDNRGNGRYDYGRQGMRGNPVTSAMRDLEMIFRRARVDSHEANHFRRALSELDDFNRHAARGRFDRGSLNSALDNMGDLARADQLHPRDRQIIRARMDDLRRMRGYDNRW